MLLYTCLRQCEVDTQERGHTCAHTLGSALGRTTQASTRCPVKRTRWLSLRVAPCRMAFMVRDGRLTFERRCKEAVIASLQRGPVTLPIDGSVAGPATNTLLFMSGSIAKNMIAAWTKRFCVICSSQQIRLPVPTFILLQFS